MTGGYAFGQDCRVRGGRLWCLFFSLICSTALHADPPRFVEVAARSGVTFRHVHGGTGKRYFVETMGAGCAFLDYNGDGRPDLFAVNGGALPGYAGERPLNRLYRNEGKGSFTDVTAQAGVGMTAYGMGCCAGDYDNDGHVDLYVSCYGPNSLFRNNGDGTFTDVARAAGVAGDSAWGVGCAFLDYDHDGYLDLYVGNYVAYSITPFVPVLRPYTGSDSTPARDASFYPHPDNFKGVSDRLYHNNGDGTFTDVTGRAGVYNPGGKAMGLVCGDYDDDGYTDIFVANDMTPDFLYHNNGDGTFTDAGLLAGVAYSGDGNVTSSMGADFGDYDGDGRPDLVVTHFQREGAALYHNEGGGMFTDVSLVSGIQRITRPYVHWGVHFLDYDNSGGVGLMMATGHVLDNAELMGSTYAQPALLLRHDGGGRFSDVTREAGQDLSAPRVGRGAAFGDYDDDGDVDVFVNQNNGPAALFRNDGVNQGHWLRVALVGGARKVTSRESQAAQPVAPIRLRPTTLSQKPSDPRPATRDARLSNRDGIGAKVTVWSGGRGQTKEVRSGSSYMSQNDLRLHFGLGKEEAADSVLVRWPGGGSDRLGRVAADREVVIRQGETKKP